VSLLLEEPSERQSGCPPVHPVHPVQLREQGIVHQPSVNRIDELLDESCIGLSLLVAIVL